MNLWNYIHIIFFALTLFFVGRCIYIGRWQMGKTIREKYPDDINLKRDFPFHLFRLYKNVFYYTFVHKDPVIQQFRKKWFLNAFCFVVSAIITGALNDMLY